MDKRGCWFCVIIVVNLLFQIAKKKYATYEVNKHFNNIYFSTFNAHKIRNKKNQYRKNVPVEKTCKPKLSENPYYLRELLKD